MMSGPALSLHNLALGYDGRVVMDVRHMEVPSGGLVCVIGPSGVGKSTFLEGVGLMSNTFVMAPGAEPELAIAGERYDPQALWAGPVQKLAQLRRERFSFIFQSTNLMPNFTVGENIRMAHQGAGSADFDQRVAQLMDRVGLPVALLGRATHQLSGGQRQRVAFVRALSKEFTILMADEPTGNLDHANAESLFGLLRSEVAQRGRTAVVVTHQLDLAEEFADLILDIVPGGPDAPATIIPRSGR